MMGFKLMKNFNLPYFSKNVKEFWQRWHISLSSWFKDYVYFSLGGSYGTLFRTSINLFLVFLISGLWHGANWTFVIWGVLNGLYILFNLFFKIKFNKRFDGFVSVLVTFLFINFSWIFFRSNTVTDAFIIVRKIFSFNYSLVSLLTLDYYLLILGFVLIVGLFLYENFLYKNNIDKYNSSFKWKNYVFYVVVIFLTFVLGNFGEQQFIYFQF